MERSPYRQVEAKNLLNQIILAFDLKALSIFYIQSDGKWRFDECEIVLDARSSDDKSIKRAH